MLRNSTLLCLFLLMIAPLYSQQPTRISGQVFDGEDSSPLEGAYVGIRGGTGSYTGEDGFFELVLDDPSPVTLIVKYLGYLSQSIKVDPREGKILSVKMVSDPIALESTLITDQALRKVHGDDALHIKDYTFFGEHYLMIVQDEEFRQNKLVLMRADGRIMTEHFGFGEEPKSLVTDCMGLKHFLTKNYACQVDLVDGTLWVQLADRTKFDTVVAPCLGFLDGTYYFEDRFSKYGSVFYYIEQEELVKRGFYMAVDSASLTTLEDEALMPTRFASTPILSKFHVLLDGLYLSQVVCPQSFVPLHIIKDQVAIFDHNRGNIVRFDESMKKVSEIPIGYHEERFWQPTLVVDEDQRRVFAVYAKFEKTTMAEISVEDGSILRELELPKSFISNIKVKGDEVFFLYKDNVYDPIQRLYAFDMTR